MNPRKNEDEKGVGKKVGEWNILITSMSSIPTMERGEKKGKALL